MAFVVLAGFAEYGGWDAVVAFVVSAAAVCLLASLVGRSVEQLGDRFGPGATGVLQSALGNLPELFICIFSLKAGLVDVVRAALVGSILANLLLVLGLAFVVGGLKHGTQPLGSERARTIVVLMLLSVSAMAIPSFTHWLHTPAAAHEDAFSVIVSVLLLALFALSLPFSLRRDSSDGGEPHETPRWPLALAIGLLAVAGVGAAFVSDWFVNALQPAMDSLSINETRRAVPPCWSCALMAAMASSIPRPSLPCVLLRRAMVAVSGSPETPIAETVMFCPSLPYVRGEKLRAETAVAPLESTAVLVALATVRDEVNAWPAVPKPMSPAASLPPELSRKPVPLPLKIPIEVPSNEATRPAACKAGVAPIAALIADARSAPDRGTVPRGISGCQVDGGNGHGRGAVHRKLQMREPCRVPRVIGRALNAGVIHRSAGAGCKRAQPERIGGIAGGLNAEDLAARIGERQRPCGVAAHRNSRSLQSAIAVDLGPRSAMASAVVVEAGFSAISTGAEAPAADPDRDVGGHERVAGSGCRDPLKLVARAGPRCRSDCP